MNVLSGAVIIPDKANYRVKHEFDSEPYKQRNIVALIVVVGRGRVTLDAFRKIFAARDKNLLSALRLRIVFAGNVLLKKIAAQVEGR